MGHHHRNCIHCIMPPHILKKVLENGTPAMRKAALSTLLATERLRGKRSVQSLISLPVAPANGARTIYDLSGGTSLGAAVLARGESSAASRDGAANRAFDGFGKTRDFYMEVFKRNSIDGKGMPLNGYVHYGNNFDNAFWDGQQMVFGDGGGILFTDLTKSLDVIAHELTHGVTEHTAGLEYHGQSGALNESISDVMGSLVKQYALKQTANQADWLIGAEVWTPGIGGDALRSMKAPGTAYDNNMVGKDEQPGDMSGYKELPDDEDNDWGGVHLYSGIPNRAFYETATGIGGYAWEAAGQIWYESLLASHQTSQFQDFAETTFVRAGRRYGTGSNEQKAVQAAWGKVGISVTVPSLVASGARDGTCAELSDKIEKLARQVEVLSGRVDAR